MITVDDIKKWSKVHPIGEGARRTRISNKEIEFSIVGGMTGLYGDFKDTFEVAILDKNSGGFVTRFFSPDSSEDIIPYLSGERLEGLVNWLIKGDDFQVR